MSQELKRTFHQVTLEEQEQVSSQKPRRGSLWATEQGAAKTQGTDVRQSSQPPVAQTWHYHSGHSLQESLPFSIAFLVYSSLAGFVTELPTVSPTWNILSTTL